MAKNPASPTVVKPRQYTKIGVLVLVAIVAVFFGYHALHHATAAIPARRPNSEQVTVASVSSLSPANAPLSVIGQVTSVDQATILSQAAGEIVTLNKNIGDSVYAGETIATIENSSQQAAVIQAQGAYDAANVALVKAGGGTASDSTDTTSIDTSQSASDAQTSIAAALESAYVALDDAVHTKADAFFNSPRSVNPTLIQSFDVAGNGLVLKIQNERLSLEGILSRDYLSTQDPPSADLTANIDSMVADAQTVQTFLNDLATAVNTIETQNELNANTILSPSIVSGYQTSIAAARTEVAGAISDLTAALDDYDPAGQQASVEQALGALDAAKAALNKTIIVSPISGTIVSLPITKGDYVSSGSEVAEVSNPGSLKIIAHVSAADGKTLSAGNSATVNDTVEGTITEVSPAIDPQTGTIEVDIALTGNQTALTDGDSVTVNLDRTPSSMVSATASAANALGSSNGSASSNVSSDSTSIIIPIVALKITPTGPEVFTVDPAKHVLVPHPVAIGSILGDNIVVTQGLTPDLMIVTDARGFVAGENVTVKK